ncbi:hypothetical protein [Paenibacillus oleatilyticus]|uniref:hypothetical protein n=1 Tax=Paenibacillus oleatilyticus TaxID=2594886 RepID=UPI001C1F6826|nr:hypothetical protein [Paenibacillus oleatilyticus]MBU7316147.1 hypothetical protein [Paenibacillus oleatilyticus]
MSKTVKNLSMSLVKKQDAAKYKDKKRVNFDDVKVDVDVVFRPSKRNLVVAEMLDVLHNALVEKKKMDGGVGLIISNALIVKHFTSIETDAEDYEGLINMLTLLTDGEYLEKIMNAFEKEQLEIMYEELNKAILMTKEIIEIETEKAKVEGEKDADVQ